METPRSEEQLVIKRLDECTFRQAVELWNVGFSGYYSDMTTTLESFVPRLGRLSIRPELSVAAYLNGEPAGFVLIALKTVNGAKVAWNGGTGVNPAFRGRGIAKTLMREAAEILKAERVPKALLEVVQKNTGAIKAYESACFRIADGLIGARRDGSLPDDRSLLQPSETDDAGMVRANVASIRPERPPEYRAVPAKPYEIGKLPFYREAAWTSQWYNLSDGEGLIVLDGEGNPAAYALLRKRTKEDGTIDSITVYQCEADPSREDSGELQRWTLSAAFGPAELACKRTTDNLSMSNPETVKWLEEAGFETVYTQYLMIADFSGGQP